MSIAKCEIRPGIGLCDECGLPKFPQQYVGMGCMICLDCLEPKCPEGNPGDVDANDE